MPRSDVFGPRTHKKQKKEKQTKTLNGIESTVNHQSLLGFALEPNVFTRVVLGVVIRGLVSRKP